MRFSENRKLAWAVLAVCVLVSVFGFGGMALSRERSAALTVYDRGSDPTLSTRHSVDAYLDDAAENAKLMASEARLRIGDTPEGSSIDALAGKVAELKDTNARYEAFTALKADVEKLYEAVSAKVTGTDFTNFKAAYDDFREDANRIKYDDYCKLAAQYNESIVGFPAGVVANLTGQGALNTFGG